MAVERIVVTGGVGYVGRELVRQFIEGREHEVHVIDNLASGEHRLEQMERDRFHLHRLDIRDVAAVRSALREISPQKIFHLAAVHYIPTCERNPGDAVAINVAGTVNLLDAAAPGTRFVFASTAAVYAPSADAHVEENIGTGPVDVYGVSKLQGEQFVQYYHQKGRIEGIIVRLFNVVGSGETNPHLAPAIIEQLSDGKTSLELGNLFPHRDYIDVSDVGSGFRRLSAVRPGGEPLVCNLGTGRTSQVGEMVRLIAKASGKEVSIVQSPDRMRAVDRPMLRASTRRLQSVTGWTPQTTLETSMLRAWSTRHEDRLR